MDTETYMGWMMGLSSGWIRSPSCFSGSIRQQMAAGGSGRQNVITSDELNRVYRNMYDNYKELLKDQMDETFAKSLRNQAPAGS
jgi:hypothetical protein